MFNVSTKNNSRHCEHSEAIQGSIRIKICGVKNPDIATQAVALGADYIGLVFHPASKRHVDLPLAKSIAKATIAAGGIPVAVCVNQNLQALQAIIDITGITVVQLHGDHAKAAHHKLAANYTRIYVQAINTDGSVANDKTDGLQHCLPERDFLLIDNIEAGQGKTLPWDRLNQNYIFTKSSSDTSNLLNAGCVICRGIPCGCQDLDSVAQPFRFGLAGGLNPANVATAITQVKPDFVDVSSGVETTSGEKDIALIAAFIQQVRGHSYAHE